MPRLFPMLATAAFAATAAAQFSVVVPNGFATAVENSANAFPFASIAATFPGLKIQHVYDSTEITNQLVTFPILITGVRWRAQDTAATWTGGTYSNVTISLSTAAVDHASTTTNYATNHGPDLAVKHTGPVAVGAGPGNGVGVPGPWHVVVPFATPFLYDPNAGDLAVEVDLPTPATNWGGGSFTALASTSNTAAPIPVPLPLARRVFGSTLYPNANGVDQNILVMQIDYTPAAGLYAGFSANVTGGVSPLAVNFTDGTFTSDPGGVTSWQWDLNGDNVIDSVLQNPSFVYTTCGNYNVSLTVTDASHPPSTLTRTAYIKTDEVTANFTYALLVGPNIFQFTDTSTPAGTAWDWDFNGDNITDSTAQHPVWPMPLCQTSVVRLITTLNCKSDTETKNIFLAPSTISTLFSGGNGGAALWTVYWDVNVTNPSGINICGLGTNSTTAANAAFSLDTYITPTTYVGKNSTPAAWRFVGNAAGTTSGANTQSLAGFASPVYLPFGTYGMAVRYIGAAPAYTNGPLGPYSNADVTLTLGISQATTTAPFTGGTPFTPRVWNGAIHYDTLGGAATAGYGFFGAGCAGSMGITNMLHTSRPQIGNTLTVNLNNLPQSIAIQMIGFSNTISGFGPLPVDVTPFGAPGCYGRVSPDVTAFLLGGGNAASWTFGVPLDPTLIGLLLYNQALVLDPGFNALGAVLSDATGMMIGN